MSSDPNAYDLNELARAADITPRTIRYYVQLGLLAAPGTRGPGTRYDQGHLDRLLLIKRWQKLHLPLAEVRRRLERMGDAEVRAALDETPVAPDGGSALDYVRALMRPPGAPEAGAEVARGTAWQQRLFPRPAPSPPRPPLDAQKVLPADPPAAVQDGMTFTHHPAFSPARPTEAPPATALSEGASTMELPHLQDTDANVPHPSEARGATRSTWERVPLTADIELHLRRPLTREHNRAAERLIELARQLFQEEV